ncbi:MAG: hypothetical protein A3I39_02635 [Candidatus Yanofskybacteria bacterium RIFCSPLOWO2_02_FULL_47_9b]|uniref:Uncharacterized protein n=1 Tax=Candidatus Yanofskybacteria bacterium RIFCSPLOWO2_02_FULL_47_9b TaxID=1802708 RepID=A0A1F8H6A0_9BACT|nr:MAG: hypothetical protein A3I39_02635 [Candidatus Yanofskybacteria bacterium RIFCSPLOWO2_02_FULL_47_9b]
MNTMAITIKPSVRKGKFVVEMDANRLEKLASMFGMYNPDFLDSLERAERDVKAGRVYKLRSLRDLRK